MIWKNIFKYSILIITQYNKTLNHLNLFWKFNALKNSLIIIKIINDLRALLELSLNIIEKNKKE